MASAARFATGRPNARTSPARSSKWRLRTPSETRLRLPIDAATCLKNGGGSWTTGRNSATRDNPGEPTTSWRYGQLHSGNHRRCYSDDHHCCRLPPCSAKSLRARLVRFPSLPRKPMHCCAHRQHCAASGEHARARVTFKAARFGRTLAYTVKERGEGQKAIWTRI